jgi:hypothetical protein
MFLSTIINIALSFLEINYTFRNDDFLYRKKNINLAINSIEPLILFFSFSIFGEKFMVILISIIYFFKIILNKSNPLFLNEKIDELNF